MAGAILLTGGTGFLGSNLLKRLVALDRSIVLLKRSKSNVSRIQDFLGHVRSYDFDRVTLDQIFKENRIDLIIHCATNYGRNEISPTEIVEANLVLPLHLLQAAEKHGVRAFINTDTILDKRINAYSLSKKQFLDWLKLYSQKLVCINMALEHFYGPFDDRSKFVTQIIMDLLTGVERLDLTPGEQKRDFIHIDDVVSAFEAVIRFTESQSPGFFPFEIGSGETVEIRDFVQLIYGLVGNKQTRLCFGSLNYRENEVMESQVDLSNIRRLGWAPTIPLKQGLMDTIGQERKRLAK